MPVPALILIDLQNDFLAPGGPLGDGFIRPDDILTNIRIVASAFKDKGYPVVNVRSEYGLISEVKDAVRPIRYLERTPGDEYHDVPMNDAHHASTHTGNLRLCVPGSPGAEFPAAVNELSNEFCDIVITKHWYSAFTDTTLHKYLQDRGVGNGPLYFVGVTATTCVLASLTDGFFLGYQVFCIRECVGVVNASKSVKRLQESLKKIDKYYGSVISVETAVSHTIEGTTRQPARVIYWVNGSIPSWRVMMVLAHKNLPYRRKRMFVLADPRETRVPEFEALNPRCKTPVLIDEDGTMLIESMAIMEYLEAYYTNSGDGPLIPNRTAKREYALTLQRFHESENLHYVFDDIELLLKHTAPYDTALIDTVIETYENTMRELKLLETQFSSSRFAAGEAFTIADCALYPSLAYCVHRGLDLGEEGFINLARYYDEIYAMSCAREACPTRWQEPGPRNLFQEVKTFITQRPTNTQPTEAT